MPLNWYSLAMKTATRVNLLLAAFVLCLLRRVVAAFRGRAECGSRQMEETRRDETRQRIDADGTSS